MVSLQPGIRLGFYPAVSGESKEVVGCGKCLIISSVQQTNKQIQNREGRERGKRERGEILICGISQFPWPIAGYHPDIQALNLELGGDE